MQDRQAVRPPRRGRAGGRHAAPQLPRVLHLPLGRPARRRPPLRAGADGARPLPHPLGAGTRSPARPAGGRVAAPAVRRRAALTRRRSSRRSNARSNGVGLVPEFDVGDWVSMHWEWVCDRLTPASSPRCATTRGPSRHRQRSAGSPRRDHRARLRQRFGGAGSRSVDDPGAFAASRRINSPTTCRGGPGSCSMIGPAAVLQVVVGVRAAEADGCDRALQRTALA